MAAWKLTRQSHVAIDTGNEPNKRKQEFKFVSLCSDSLSAEWSWPMTNWSHSTGSRLGIRLFGARPDCACTFHEITDQPTDIQLSD